MNRKWCCALCGAPAVLLDVPGFEEAHGFPPLDPSCKGHDAGFYLAPSPPPSGIAEYMAAMPIADPKDWPTWERFAEGMERNLGMPRFLLQREPQKPWPWWRRLLSWARAKVRRRPSYAIGPGLIRTAPIINLQPEVYDYEMPPEAGRNGT